jgi:glycine/D-amino acid oxidase-like deaminating enzyme/nitrite reductase/ring-hydroxylating ferredoxin subunit
MGSIWFDEPTEAVTSDDLGAAMGRTWDLAVVGGGIVGLLCALRARQHGLDVCLVDAGQVGEGTTAHSTIKVTSGHGGVVAQIAERHGPVAAIAYQRANDAGYASLAALVGALPEDVRWDPQPHLVYATDESGIAQLRNTAEVAMRAGSPISRSAAPAWTSGEAWEWGNTALVQPLSLARAIGRLLQQAGVPIFQRTTVTKVHAKRSTPSISLEGGGELRARDVLIASHSPVHDPDLLTMREEFYRHAAIALPVPDQVVPTSYEVDGISTRPVTYADGRPGAVVVGQSRRVSQMQPRDWDYLQDWAIEALGAEPATHRWGAQDPRSLDYLPYVGRTRREQRVLVVTALNGWGFTNAAAIADRLPAMLLGEDSDQPPWEARRIKPSGGWSTAASNTAWVSRSLVGDYVRSTFPEEELRPGQGRVVGGPFHPRAECVTADGVRHEVSARCTHMGCLVRWNTQEESWDCPCHGSRFAPDGEVLEGPAHSPLA